MARNSKLGIDIRATDNASKTIVSVGNSIGALQGKVAGLAGVIGGAFATRRIIEFGRELSDLFFKQERAELTVLAGLRRIGTEVDQTHASMLRFASDLQTKTIFGDEDVLQGVIGQLLTFRNLGGEVFERTTKLALDLSATLGTDLQSSAIQLGKALNDPITGMSMLSRSGITFSQTTKDIVKEMVSANNLLGAQDLILSEIEAQYGGLAETLADSAGGAVIQFGNQLGDLKESFGEVLSEALLPFIEKLSELVGWVQSWPGPAKKIVVILGAITAGLFGAVAAVSALTLAFGAFNLATGGILLAVGAAITGLTLLIVWLASNWDKVRFTAMGFFDAIKTHAQIAASWLVEKFGGAINLVLDGIKLLVKGYNALPDWLRPGAKVDLSHFDTIKDKLAEFGSGTTREQLRQDFDERERERRAELRRREAEREADKLTEGDSDIVFPQADETSPGERQSDKKKTATTTRRGRGAGADQPLIGISLLQKMIVAQQETTEAVLALRQVLGNRTRVGSELFSRTGRPEL